MRYPIWEKEDYFQVGEQRFDMDPSVVTWDGSTLPLAWMFNHNRAPLGHVTDLRLEDGEITGEFVLYDSSLKDEDIKEFGIRFGGYYTPVEKANGVVTKARLRSVSAVLAKPAGANPGIKVEEKIDAD